MGGLSSAALERLSPDFAWQQLPTPAANALEGAAADSGSAAALAALETVLNNAPLLEGDKNSPLHLTSLAGCVSLRTLLRAADTGTF